MDSMGWINHWSITNHWSSTASWGLRPQACNGSMCCTWQLARQVSNKVGHRMSKAQGAQFSTRNMPGVSSLGQASYPPFIMMNHSYVGMSTGTLPHIGPAPASENVPHLHFSSTKSRQGNHSGGVLKGRIDGFWELFVFPFCFFSWISISLLLCFAAFLLLQFLFFCFACFSAFPVFLFLKPEQSLRYIIENKP